MSLAFFLEETGYRRQETRDKRQETRDKRQETRDRRQDVGLGIRGMRTVKENEIKRIE